MYATSKAFSRRIQTYPLSNHPHITPHTVPTTSTSHCITHIAYHNEYCVGAINSRIETFDPEDNMKKISYLTPADPLVQQKQRKKQLVSADGKPLRYRLHITTLAVLEVYRNAKIGTTLLNDVLATADQKASDIDEVAVWVHTSNESAINFYKRFGFTESGLMEGYYKNDVVSPPDAILMTRPTQKPTTAVAGEEKPE